MTYSMLTSILVMGIISSLLGWNQGRTDDPDPVTGLTSRDKHLIRSSWEPLKKNVTENGVTLLLLLFETYPEEMAFFPFKDIPLNELKSSKMFQAHCNSVMYALTSIVDSLDDSELLVQILIKTGDSHARRRIKIEDFTKLKKVALDLFAKLMSPQAVKSWQKALDVAFQVIGKQLGA